jgi:hypothetical protein
MHFLEMAAINDPLRIDSGIPVEVGKCYQSEVLLGRLENKIDGRFNALEAKINGFEAKLNNQRTLMIVAIVGVIGQIINTWVLHGFVK